MLLHLFKPGTDICRCILRTLGTCRGCLPSALEECRNGAQVVQFDVRSVSGKGQNQRPALRLDLRIIQDTFQISGFGNPNDHNHATQALLVHVRKSRISQSISEFGHMTDSGHDKSAGSRANYNIGQIEGN